MKEIKAVLDSNQFIFRLRDEKEFCVDILKLSGIKFTALISDTIVEEVFLRLKELEGKDFASLVIHIIKNLNIKIIDDRLVPPGIIEKYMKIKIKTGNIELEAELNNSETAKKIYGGLPMTGMVKRWGDEIYFEIPLHIDLEENFLVRLLPHKGRR